MTEKIGKKRIGRIIAVTLLAMTLIVGLIPNQALAAETKIADPSTITKYTDSLGDEVSTEYAGRIWTDKSVYADDAEILLKTGQTQKIENTSDFLVTYSALATSQQISGSTQAPVDVVFIIDTSGSMLYDMSETDETKRIVNTVDALNDAIDAVMKMNDYTRVSVVAFSTTSEVLLPLGRYEKGTRTNNGQTVTDYFSLSGNNSSTLRVHAKVEDANDTVTDSRSITGGTNIQRGIYEGMNVLVTEENTTAEINGSTMQRVPSVVLLSDGAPTFSIEDTGSGQNARRWWNPTNNGDDGDGNNPYYGNGMKALMTGAYMKEAINRNYGVTGTAMETTMYTIGMGITGLENYYEYGRNEYYTGEQDLAYMTLNPKANWDADNDMAEDIVAAWTTYITNDGVPRIDTDDGESYQLRHPSQYDIDTDADALKNLVDDYYDADSASAVTNVFKQIVANIAISAPEVPTELKHADALTTGYIYYTDPIGKYMEVKSIKGIIYDGTYYAADANGKFNQEVDTELYGKQNLSSIAINITGTAGVDQVLEIDVPAALIPLRINTVELNDDGSVKSHTNNGSWPIRVIYEVGLVEDIITKDDDGNRVVDTTKLSAEYLAANTDAATGNVNFYSNLYTDSVKEVDHEHSVGNATVEFEPAHTNPFYYMQEPDAIYQKVGDEYVQVEGSSEDNLDDNATYYYINDYYHGTSVETEYLARTGIQLKKVEIVSIDGKLYRAAGSPRLNRILEFAGQKSTNATETAHDFYLPTFKHADDDPDPAAGKYVIYLGNNGKLSLPGTGALEISKTVNVAEGLKPATNSFTFTVDFNGDTAVAGTFNYEIVGTETTGTIKDGGTLTLTDGQTARITGLAPGTTYTVEEKKVAGFTTAATGDTGTITAGETSEANFVNTYEVTPIEYPPTGDTGFTGKKVLEGRAWDTEHDSYTFLLTPYNNAPLPDGYNTANGVTVTNANEVSGTEQTTYEAAFDFGKITYTAPGTYRYTVVEKEIDPTQEAGLPGMSYSRALYRIVVTVTDNGDGTLKASADIQKLYTDDATPLFTYDDSNNIVMNSDQTAQDSIVFTNKYSAESVTRTPVATKTYTDKSGENPLVSGMFSFKLEAVAYKVDDGDWNTDLTGVDFPMNAGYANGETTVNEGGNVTFHSITFKNEHILSGAATTTYKYKLTEVMPAGATADNNYTVNGMKYDPSVYYAYVKLSRYANSQYLVVTTTYEKEGQTGVSHVPNFVNEYTPAPVTISKDTEDALHGTKTLNFAEGLEPNDLSFNFTVEAENDAAKTILEEPQTKTVTVNYENKEAVFWFDDMTFSKPGTYVFNITEEAGTADYVTYDTHTTVATVTVEDKNGVLEASVSYNNGSVSTDTDKAQFINTYTVDPATEEDPQMVQLAGVKKLTGKDLVKGEFFFEVYDEQTKTSYLIGHEADEDKDGIAEISFPDTVTFTKPGTYSYIIKEQIPDNKVEGTIYDTTEYKFTAVVKDTGDGKLDIVSTSLVKLANTGNVGATDVTVDFDQINFYNTYTPTPVEVTIPPVTKVLSGDRKDALKAGEFEFELTLVDADPEDGITLPETTKVENAADGTVLFDKVTITKAGTYTVKISEIVPDGLTENADGTYTDPDTGITYSTQEIITTLKATDDRNGKLTLTITENIGGKTITNEYDTETVLGPNGNLQLAIKKELTGRGWNDNDVFDFEVIITDPATQTAVDDGDLIFPADANGIQKVSIGKTTENKTIVCPDITFKKPGTYKFIVREVTGSIPGITYDPVPQEVVVEATDNGDGTMDITVNGKSEDLTLTFTNEYDAESTALPGHDYLKINKEVTGRAWNDTDVFKFTLAADPNDAGTIKAIEDKIVVLPNNASGLDVTTVNKADAHFGNITFHEAGVYKFIIKEVAGNSEATRITYDDHTVYVTVTVTDDGEGQLVAAPTYNGSMTFKNEYVPEPIEVTLSGIKELTGRSLKDGEFAFQISKAEGTAESAPLPEETTVKNTKNGDIQFSTMKFTEAGTFTYIIDEAASGLSGVTDDEGTVEAVVIISYDETTGTFSKDVSYIKKNVNSEGEGFKFVNKYIAEGTDPVDFKLQKAVTTDGTNSFTMKDGDFNFEIEPSAANPDSDPVARSIKANEASGLVTFVKQVKFTEAGTYVYTVHEVAGSNVGITYDPTIYTITVEVTDNLQGKLVSDITVKKLDANGQESDVNNGIAGITFENKYTPKSVTAVIHGHKILDGGHKALASGEFTFNLEAVTAGAPMPTVTSTKNMDTGLFQFGMITFNQVGVYKYKVTEVQENKAGYVAYNTTNETGEVTVTVTDPENNGQLVAAVEGIVNSDGTPGIQFHNTYDPADVSITLKGEKNLDGRDIKDGEFKFQLLDSEGDEIAVEPCDADGNFEFNLTYEKAGVYTYTINELHTNIPGITYDGRSYSAKVTVTLDEAQAALVAKAEYVHEDTAVDKVVFDNAYNAAPTSVQLSTLKRLEGRQLKAGEFSFKIEAVTEGAPMPDEGERVIKNNAEGVATFGIMTYDKAGTYAYKVTEEQGTVEHVTYDKTVYDIVVEITDDGNGYLKASLPNGGDKASVFTNIYKEPEPPAPNPAKITFEKLAKVGEGEAVATPQNVKAGDIVTYYMNVRNAVGGGVAENIVITDKIPEGLILIDEGTGTEKDGVITWNINQLAAGTGVSVYFKVKVPEVAVDTTWENIATLTYDDPEDPTDPDKEDPSDPVVIKEDVEPALTVKKVASKNDVKSSDEVTYTITVKNTGDGKAANVVVTDDIPDGLAVTAISEGGVNNDGIVTWNIGELAPGASEVVTVTVTVPEVDKDTSWKNIATATYDEPGDPTDPTDPSEPKDPVPSEPEIIVVDVNPIVELIKKQAINDEEPSSEKQTVKAGDLITYYLTVVNNGTETAENIVITDTVPAGLEMVEAGEGTEADGKLTWTVASLAAGESKTVYFIVSVPEVDVNTTYENTAQLTYDGQNGTPEDGEEPGTPDNSNTVVIEQAGPEPEPVVPDEPEPTPEPEEPEEETPDTGDKTNLMLWLILLAVSGTGLTGLAVYKRRRS